MVKISTAISSNFGTEMRFGELHIKFDKLGYAEVESQEIADQLVSTYAGWLFLGDIPKVKKDKPQVDNSAIQADLERAVEKVIDREATIAQLEKELKMWKDQIEGFKVDAEKAKTELEGFTIQKGKEIEELNLKVSLAGKTLKELTEVCLQMEIPEDRYKAPITKGEVIQIILDESREK